MTEPDALCARPAGPTASSDHNQSTGRLVRGGRQSGRPRQRHAKRVLALATAGVAAAVLFGGAGSSFGLTGCTLQPVLQDTLVTQGLNSYPSLVRGKETLVRFYFSLPSCAVSGNAIQINDAQLTVKNGTAVLNPGGTPTPALAPIGTSTPPLITSTAKQIDATSDPKWIVPGSALAPTSTTAAYTATFSATITYQSETSSGGPLSAPVQTNYAIAPGTRSTAITKSVGAKSKAMRILVVPMGVAPTAPAAAPTLTAGSGSLASGTYTYKVSSTNIVGESPLSTAASITASGSVNVTWPSVTGASGYKVYRNDQLIAALGQVNSFTDDGSITPPITQTTSAARQTLQNALTTFQRTAPMEDAGGRLDDLGGTTSTAGLRYTVNTGFVNLASFLVNGMFCGSNTNFSTIDSSLMSILNVYNASNTTNPADVVLGVVDGAQSISAVTNPLCFEGEASPGSSDAWIRLVADTATTRSQSGSVAAQEIAHTKGIEPKSRSNGAFHSIYSTAHNVSGDPGKTYDILERNYIISHLTGSANVDRTALIASTTTGLNDSVSLYEQADWNDMWCFLGGPVPTLTGSACTSTTTGTVGVGTGVPASAPGPAIAVTATTDGTRDGTTVTETFAKDELVTLTAPDPSSPYHIVERDGSGNILLDFQAPPGSEGHSSDHVELLGSPAMVGGTIRRPAAAAQMELWKGAPGSSCGSNPSCLYSTHNDGAAPTIGNSDATTPSNLPQLKPGGTDTLSKTVRIPAIPKTPDPKPDVYLLADTTASMGPALTDVKSSANGIVNDYNGKTGTDPCFAVGNYKDFADPGAVFTNQLSFSGCGSGDDPHQASAASTAIGTWSPAGGGDWPEAQLYALHQLATGAAAFRSGSQKTLIWFGDAPGHDPICGSIYSVDPAPNITTDGVAQELKDAGVTVYPIGVTSSPDTNKALDNDPASFSNDSIWADCATASGASLQATRIANATGGVVTLAPSDQISTTILKVLNNQTAVVEPSAACDTGLSVSFDPTSRTALTPFDARFTETVTGAANAQPGTYMCTITFKVNGTVNDSLTQTLQYDVTGLSGPHTVVTWTATDSSPMKGDLLIKCNGLFHVLKAAVVPNSSGKFLVDTTRGCPGGEFFVDVNDGWNVTPKTSVANSSIDNQDVPTEVAIASPTSTSRILQFGNVAVSGSGKGQSGPLAPGQLSWTLDGNSLGSGNTLDLKPTGAAGWGAGDTTHTLVLTGTDPHTGRKGTASVTFQILGDADNDGISTADETTINNCRPGGAESNPDQDPFNATADYDGDGMPNAIDAKPCEAETNYEASAIIIQRTLDESATDNALTFSAVFLPFRNLGDVPKANVHISKIAGYDVSGTHFNATSWIVQPQFNGMVGVAIFSKQAVIQWLRANHPEILNQTILIRMAGTSSDGSWSFYADGPVYVIKSGS